MIAEYAYMPTLRMHVNIVHTGTIATRPLYDVMFMNIIKCGYYSRAAALISLSSLKMWLLFEGGYYSGCGFYSNNYGIYNITVIRLKIYVLMFSVVTIQRISMNYLESL